MYIPFVNYNQKTDKIESLTSHFIRKNRLVKYRVYMLMCVALVEILVSHDDGLPWTPNTSVWVKHILFWCWSVSVVYTWHSITQHYNCYQFIFGKLLSNIWLKVQLDLTELKCKQRLITPYLLSYGQLKCCKHKIYLPP